MAEDWYADVKKYVPNADSSVVAGIVRYCGIALQNRDSSLVSFGDSAEVGRVRENFLKKKLGLTSSDAELDQEIAAVGERMKADRTKNRVTVYYLLAEHFGKLPVFGGPQPVADAGVGAAGLAAGAAAAAGAGVASLGARPANTDARPAAAMGGATAQTLAGGAATAGPAARSGLMRWLPWVILLAALLLLWYLFAHKHAATPPPMANSEAAAPAVATAPVVAGAPAAAATEGLPANVYFEVGSATVSGDGAKAIAAAADAIKKDSSKVAITGYTDKTGDTAKNQDLAKNRAKAVRAALEAAGVPQASIEMRPPLSVETGANGAGDAEARRVEISKV
jgi:outer membrane protein OmpA-like peptidoglycan-associated protein